MNIFKKISLGLKVIGIISQYCEENKHVKEVEICATVNPHNKSARIEADVDGNILQEYITW